MPAICPTCRESLEIPPEFAGMPVRCGACRTVFTPTPDSPGIRTFAPVDGGDGETPPPTSNVGVWLLAFLTCVMMAPCVGGCGWFCYEMLYPEFEMKTDEDGRFAAAFPGSPDPVSRSAADGTPIRGLELDRDVPDEKYFVYYADNLTSKPEKGNRPPHDPVFDTAIELILRDGRLVDSKIQKQATSQHDGYDALDLILVDDNRPFEKGIVRLVRVGDRVYVVGVAGQMNPGDVRVRSFFNRFQITGPAPPKKGNPFLDP